MTQVFAFEPPERFVAGTVGVPGERTFYLQASGGGRVITVVLEKVQVSLLAEKLEELLAEAQRRFGLRLTVPEESLADNDPLDLPLEEEFRVGTLGLSWDGETETVLVEAIAVGEFDADEPTEAELARLDRLRVRLSPTETLAFVARAKRLVAAGRPPCPLCGQPLDPGGHLCPRNNGYHR